MCAAIVRLHHFSLDSTVPLLNLQQLPKQQLRSFLHPAWVLAMKIRGKKSCAAQCDIREEAVVEMSSIQL